MRVVKRRKVGAVKARAKGRISRRRGSGIMAMGPPCWWGTGGAIPILPTRRSFLLMRTALKKDRSRAEVETPKDPLDLGHGATVEHLSAGMPLREGILENGLGSGEIRCGMGQSDHPDRPPERLE